MMKLRPFSINDAETILSWCKDKHAFRLWSADRYKEFPTQNGRSIVDIEWSKCHHITVIPIILVTLNLYHCLSSKK